MIYDFLLNREIAPKEIEEGELILPSLRHVEMEEKPQEKEKFKPELKELEEPVAYEIMFKRRKSEVRFSAVMSIELPPLIMASLNCII